MSKATWCDEQDMQSWTDSEIIEYYDLHPNLINRQYAVQLDVTCAELNEILMDRG
jgi:hypothetical protein